MSDKSAGRLALLAAGFLLTDPTRAAQLSLTNFGAAAQSSDLSATNAATRAVDGAPGSYSATLNVSNSYWEIELRRAFTVTRVELVAPAAALYSNVTSGLILRVQDLRDATAFSTTVTNPGAGGTWGVDLPAGTRGRIVRFGLENNQTNGAGTRQVVLGEVRVYGDPSPDFSPVQLGASGIATQSTDFAVTNGADKAVDGNPSTFSLTATNMVDGFWLLTLDRARPLYRVELINRHDLAAARLQGLTVRVLDDLTNTVASATATNPGPAATWGFTLPAGTTGRFVRVGLEGGATNGFGDNSVQLAEVNILTANNLALGRDAYMVRLLDTLPPATNVNDGNYATESYSTTATVDAYWELDLGQTYALNSVRAVGANGFAYRTSHSTVRLFDERHESVFAQHMITNTVGTFDTDVGGPRLARYVRVGLENKERTHPTGGIEFYLDFKEIMVFGQPASSVGLLSFAASVSNVTGGGTSTLTWLERDLHRLDLYPGGGSVGADTSAAGAGSRAVSPTSSVEYVLVGTNVNGNTARAVSVLVNGAALPLRISEFLADNVLSAEDGHGKAEDWIEIHNPNNAPVNLGGYGLSDDPLVPMKWVFPATNLAAHGHLLVFAAGHSENVDGAGFLQANFQLAAAGGSVVLTASNGVATVDAILNYPPQREDLAYGRTLAGATAFLDPTPGAWNTSASYTGWLYPPAFSQTRGFFTNAISLSITHSNAGASLFYALNGPTPTSVFFSALNIASTACVRAEVRRTGYKSPRVKTHTYIFREQVITAPYMNTAITQDPRYTNRVRQGLADLPAISVAVPVLPDDYVEREASMELFMPDGSDRQANCGFQRFGGAWQTFTKKNYRLQFRIEYGDDKLRVPLFQGFDHGVQAVESFDSLDLLGGSQDMIDRGFYMSDRFGEDAMLDMGSLNPHGRYVNVFINGTYWGQYNVRERLVDAFLADYLGGATTNYVTVRGNDNATAGFIPGTPEPPTRYPWDRVRALRTSYAAVKPYLDVPNLTDFMLLWWYGSCENEYRAAGSVEAGSGFKFWIADADGLLNHTLLPASLTYNNTANAGPGDLFGGLVGEGNSDFKTLVADRIQRHFFQAGALTPARNLARLDARMAEITNSLVTECARWGFRTPDNWQSAADTIRTGLFPQRTTNLFTYLRNRGLYPALDPPQLNQYGGSVTNGFVATLNAGAGTIYYTLDGGDPRLPGGGVAPGALSYVVGNQLCIAAGATWRYWDQGSLPATNWNQPSYSDAAWPTGRTEFGYGDGGEATTNAFGPNSNNKYPAYYYRTPFVLSDAASVTQLLVNLIRDDGAVVYLNGQELLRDNMPAGPIAYTNWAAANAANESTFIPFTIVPTNLVSGTNVLAVEIHQVGGNSTDISFNFTLTSSRPAVPMNLPVTSNTVLHARSWNGTTWSALIDVEFLMAPLRPPAGGEIVISEIHYNPDGSDNYQFIELYNAGTNLVNLGGARLSGGVDFLFPNGLYLAPGQCELVVENAAYFSNLYQTVGSPWYFPGIQVAGTWSGKLAHDGEEISLLFSNSVEIFAVAYGTDGSWPERAAGGGSSLELRSPATVPADGPSRAFLVAQGATWRSSARYHGSPGRVDSYERPVEISEALSHTDLDTDWVELHNPGLTPADVSGLYLSDSFDAPLQYRLTNGTVIAPGGYLVLSDAQLGFGFSELGANILLVEASGTNLIRFVDTVDVSAMEREETAGRYTRSDGAVDFTELRTASKGATNLLPRVGPVVMSEIMYHPATGKAEYVELVSLSSSNIALHDPAHPTNAWSLSGAVNYAFPPGAVLAPCTPIIVCSTNEAAFRTQYGVSPGVPVYGPWTGALDNAGESIKLHRPGDPELDGFVPQYRVDRVAYESIAPWPAAADAGAVSLERITLEGYGNDPGNWQASATGGSPGTVLANRLPTIGLNGDLTVNEGEPIQLSVQAADADAPWQSCTVASTNLPPGCTFIATNGALSWTPAEADGPGVYALRFVATDNAVCTPGARTQDVTITVREVNQAPGFPLLSDLHFPAETFVQRQLTASDPDEPAQALTFSQSGLPSGVELNPSTGAIEGETAAPGQYTVSVTVADDQVPPLMATGSFAVVVSEPFVFQGDLPEGVERTVSFPTISNATYEVHFTDGLTPPSWQLLERVERAPGGLLEIVDPDASSATQRFYRVIWVDVGG